MNRFDIDRTIRWQAWTRSSHELATKAMAAGDLVEAKYWQEVGAGDYDCMWIWLSQLI